MITKKFFLIGALSIGLTATLAGVSRADFLNLTVTTPSATANFSGAGPVFGLVNLPDSTGVVSTNAISTTELSQLSTGSVVLKNTSNSTESIVLQSFDGAFSLPAGTPSTLTSTLAVSNLSTAADSATQQASLLLPDGVTRVTTNPITVSGPSGAVTSSPISIGQSGAGQLTDTTTLTLAPGSSATLTVSTQAVAAVPEPTGLCAMLGMGGLFGLGLVWQRRKTRDLQA